MKYRSSFLVKQPISWTEGRQHGRQAPHFPAQPSSSSTPAIFGLMSGLERRAGGFRCPFPSCPIVTVSFLLWGVLYPWWADPALAHLPEDLLGLHGQPGFH